MIIFLVPGYRSTFPEAHPDPDPGQWYGSEYLDFAWHVLFKDSVAMDPDPGQWYGSGFIIRVFRFCMTCIV